MILRVSGKLGKKIHAAPAESLELDANHFADWSAHVFTAGRAQYILVTNTASLYSTLMVGKGITSGPLFIQRTIELLGQTLRNDGMQFIFDNKVAPATDEVLLSKALNRSVTGSMNDFIYNAKCHISERGWSLRNTALCLNMMPMGQLNYANPRKTLLKLK